MPFWKASSFNSWFHTFYILLLTCIANNLSSSLCVYIFCIERKSENLRNTGKTEKQQKKTKNNNNNNTPTPQEKKTHKHKKNKQKEQPLNE